MAKFEESNICPICDGRLIADNVVLTSNPPQYRATCEKCGKVFYSHHVIGFVDMPKVPDGMWCNDTTPSILESIADVKVYHVDTEGHFTLAGSEENK